ncbi:MULTISPECIES: hypothetical protein [unclassified Nocardia]|uniref:hypothetical protein n=1 Tax=unclassified Nocardia TaxID=2637762 RepID=UPI0033A8083F
MTTRAVRWIDRIAAVATGMGAEISGVGDRGKYGAALDVIDPDGHVVRFVADNPFRADRFLGVDFDGAGGFAVYTEPTLPTEG